jgi:hypothetical protein
MGHAGGLHRGHQAVFGNGHHRGVGRANQLGAGGLAGEQEQEIGGERLLAQDIAAQVSTAHDDAVGLDQRHMGAALWGEGAGDAWGVGIAGLAHGVKG